MRVTVLPHVEELGQAAAADLGVEHRRILEDGHDLGQDDVHAGWYHQRHREAEVDVLAPHLDQHGKRDDKDVPSLVPDALSHLRAGQLPQLRALGDARQYVEHDERNRDPHRPSLTVT